MKAPILVYLLSIANAFEYLSATVHSQDVKPSLSREIWHPRLYLAQDTRGTHYEIRDRERFYDTSISFLQKDAEDMPSVMNCRCRFTKHALSQAENFLQVVGKEEPKKVPQVKSQEIPLSINTGPSASTTLEQHTPIQSMHSYMQNYSNELPAASSKMQPVSNLHNQIYPTMMQQNSSPMQSMQQAPKESYKQAQGQGLPMTQYSPYGIQYADPSKPLNFAEVPQMQYAQPYSVVYKPVLLSPEQTPIFYPEQPGMMYEPVQAMQQQQQPVFMNQMEMPTYYQNSYPEGNGLFLKPRVAYYYPSYAPEGSNLY